MATLSASDYRSVLGFLHEAHEVDGPEPFPEPLRSSLASILRADNMWHWTIHGGSKTLRWGWGAAAVAGGFPPAVASEFAGQHAHEDPMPSVARFINVPFRRSDLVARRAWCKTGIWANIDRPLGAADWVRLWVGSQHSLLARFEFDNCREEWDDRVVALLELLTPHLRQLLQRAAARAAVPVAANGLTAREVEVLSLVAQGRTNGELARILWVSPNTVRKHLENVFEKLDVHTRSAAVARAFGHNAPHVEGTDAQ